MLRPSGGHHALPPTPKTDDGSPSRRDGRALLRAYLIVTLPLSALYVALPEPPRYLWTAIGVLSLAGLVLGTIVNRPRRRLPWVLATLGVAALMLGDTTYDVLTEVLGQENPYPSLADAFYLAMYPLLAGGLLALIRVTSPHSDKPAALDASIVTVALGLLAWVYLASPYAQDPSLTLPQKVVSMGYPLGDVLILAVLVRLLLGVGRRSRALWLLSLGTVGLFASDVVYGLVQLNGSWSTGGIVDGGWIVFYVAWGAAALTPDMRLLTEPARARPRPASMRRLIAFAMVPLAAPGMQLWTAWHGGAREVPVTALASAVLFLLCSLRLRGLLEQAIRAAERETVMRRTGEALVAASDPAAVHHVGVTAIRGICGLDTRVLVATGQPHLITFDSAGGAAVGADLGSLVRRHEADLRRQQFTFASAGDCEPALRATLTPGATILLVAMARGDAIVGLLLVSGEGADQAENIEQICALASQMTLAIESIVATGRVAERRTEAHFRSLFQAATDVILVVDEELTLRFSTPSARAVLGWDPADGAARSVESVVVTEDAPRARLLLDRALAAECDQDGSAPEEWRVLDRKGVVRVFEVSCRNLVNDPNVRGVVVTLHDITVRRKLESDLKHQAFHDSLTQLPNRALFIERVEHALAVTNPDTERLAVLLIDLDNFKVINDTRGHAAGDILLAEVADRLRSALRPGDSCARLGGDEFAILAGRLSSDLDAQEFAERLLAQLRLPVAIGGDIVTAAASIGIAISRQGSTASELLLQADLAMYAAKDAGKGGTAFFRPELIDYMKLRARTVSDLERALEQHEFELFYQPVVALDSGQVVGTEALLRWRHPQRGLLTPDSFIDIIEDGDLAVPVGQWVINTAVAQAAAWQCHAGAGSVLKMSVNVAPRDLAQPGFVGNVVAALERHQLPAPALVLEITERILAGKDSITTQAMADLTRLGVRLAVDDFGTGYSALGYLRRFPVSTLKIDRSFVAGLCSSADDHALVEAIIRLADTFDLDLVAEGVETEAQRAELLRMGCANAQGFHYSRALPAAEAEAYLCGGLSMTGS